MKVKFKPDDPNVIDLFGSSKDDAPTPTIKLTPSSQCPLSLFPIPSRPRPSNPPPPFSVQLATCIVSCLHRLASMPGRKNILEKIDYNKLNIVEVDFLPLHSDRDLMFIIPSLGPSASHSKANSMDNMDKRYNNHVWIKIQTTNISNDLKLTFCSSTCLGHLKC